MKPKLAVVVAPNWRDYAEKYLANCLTGLTKQTFKEFKIFLIDNASQKQSLNFLKNSVEKYCPNHSYQIIANVANDGFAKANNEAIKEALEQNFDYIFLLNMDTIIADSCLQELLEVAKAEPGAGAIQARLMMWPDKNKINSLGNVTHFLGFGYCRAYQEIFNHDLGIKNICYPSGAGVLLKAEALLAVGLFDEEFWMYGEDQDLGWRLWLADWPCLLAPQAVVYHKYEFSRSIKKYFWIDRNRILVILKNYRWPTLILIFPAFCLMELGLFYFAFKNGWLKEKLKIYKYFLSRRTWLYIFKARRQVQKLRTNKDAKLIEMFSGQILYQEIDSPILRMANLFFGLYWWLAKIFILW